LFETITLPMPLKRRHFLVAAASSAAIAVSGFVHMRWGEPDWFEVTRKTVPLGRFTRPLRVLHLSDFHASAVVPYATIAKAIDLALAQQPDAIFLTGDFITNKLDDADTYRNLLQRLVNAAPTFACIGNHDGGRWAGATHGYPTFAKVATLLAASGIQLLFNERTRINLPEHQFDVVGLGDIWSNDCHPEKVLPPAHAAPDPPCFVLSHNPDSKEQLWPYAWDILWCGHTHGGQLVIPFLGWRPILPVQDRRYAEGLHAFGPRYLHITRGVGNLHGVRFNCRPEVSLVEIT